MNDRKINRDASAHTRMLYDLGHTKNQIIKYFKELRDNSKVEEIYPFTPSINQKSR